MPHAIEEVQANEFRRALTNGEVSDQRPMVVRAAASEHELVRSARTDHQALFETLKASASEIPLESWRSRDGSAGRFALEKNARALNFEVLKSSVTEFLNLVLANASEDDASASTHYAGGIEQEVHFPSLSKLPCQDYAPAIAKPYFWIGNQTNIAIHNDAAENVAVVVAGRRRFTVFPPDQVKNLYLGPLDFSPAGRPISLVDVSNPDLRAFPRFEEALQSALIVELSAGDMIHIPSFWWHSVEGLEPVNVLVNYWWEPGSLDGNAGLGPLFLSMLVMDRLSPGQRRAWKHMFDHFVFHENGRPTEHLSDSLQPITDLSNSQNIERMKRIIRYVHDQL